MTGTFYNSPYFYLALSFGGFLLILYRYAYPIFIQGVDNYTGKISDLINQSEQAKKQAAIKNQTEIAKLDCISMEIDSILKDAKNYCQNLKQEFSLRQETRLRQQQQHLQKIILIQSQEFKNQLTEEIVNQIIVAVDNWVEKNNSQKIQRLAQKQAIQRLSDLANQ